MEPNGVTGRESLELWLAGRPQLYERNARYLHHRAALRLLPVWIEANVSSFTRFNNFSALPILRALLTASLECATADPDVDIVLAQAERRLDDLIVSITRLNFKARFMRDDIPESEALSFLSHAAVAEDIGQSVIRSFSLGEAKGYPAALLESAVSALQNLGITSDGWQEVGRDAADLDRNGPLFGRLWHRVPDKIDRLVAGMRNDWAANEPARQFWMRWYQAILDGKAIDPNLLLDIALIPDAEWSGGEAHIAGLIAGLEERHQLLNQIADLMDQLRSAQAALASAPASELQRSHNHPPELVDAPAIVRRQTQIIWAALSEAEAELKGPDPKPSILRRIGQTLLEAFKALVVYCASLGDLILTKAAEEIGSTGTKWAFRAGATYLLAKTSPAQSIGQALIDLAGKIVAGG